MNAHASARSVADGRAPSHGRGRGTGPTRVTLLGVGLDALTEAEVNDRVVSSARAGTGGTVVTPNLHHLRELHHGSPLWRAYDRADLVVADGQPLVWASRLAGTPVPERVAGSSLLWTLSAAAARAGLPVYLLGGQPGAAEAAAASLAAQAPGLRVVGTACPPVGFEREAGWADVLAAQIATARPAIVFTALGAPKQELVNTELAPRLPGVWFLGVGAAVDMAGGIVTRAPRWMQRLGVEWVFRLVQEPGRLARRYLVEGLPFALLLFACALRGRWRGRRR